MGALNDKGQTFEEGLYAYLVDKYGEDALYDTFTDEDGDEYTYRKPVNLLDLVQYVHITKEKE